MCSVLSKLGYNVILVVLFLSIIPIMHAAPIDIYEISFVIDSSTIVKQDFIFLEPVNQQIPISIPRDAKDLYVFKDNVLVQPIISDNRITNQLTQNKEISVTYSTKEFVDNSRFLVNLNMPYDVNKLIVKAKLPQGVILSKAISNGSIASSSVYPSPTSLTTDGQSIVIEWQFDGLAKGQEIAFFTEYKEKSPVNLLIIISAAIIIIALLLLYVIFRKPKEREVIREKEVIREVYKGDSNIDEHLKEDEAQIVRILKDREGHVEQGTLRIITGFSKARLSVLLKELEDRKIIIKELRGKKNLVFLRKR